MSGSAFVDIFRALNGSGARYVVVGGVAVVLHGFLRFTADLDLVVALAPENALRTIDTLTTLGFTPRPPVQAEQFADPAIRQTWVRDKGLTVFSLWSTRFPGTDVDLFVEEPIPFDELLDRAETIEISGLAVPVASITDLIRLKRAAGRPKDEEDIRALERIARLRDEVERG